MAVNEPEARGVALAMQTVLDDVGKGMGPALVAALITAFHSRCAAFHIFPRPPLLVTVFSISAGENGGGGAVIMVTCHHCIQPATAYNDTSWTEINELMVHNSLNTALHQQLQLERHAAPSVSSSDDHPIPGVGGQGGGGAPSLHWASKSLQGPILDLGHLSCGPVTVAFYQQLPEQHAAPCVGSSEYQPDPAFAASRCQPCWVRTDRLVRHCCAFPLLIRFAHWYLDCCTATTLKGTVVQAIADLCMNFA